MLFSMPQNPPTQIMHLQGSSVNYICKMFEILDPLPFSTFHAPDVGKIGQFINSSFLSADVIYGWSLRRKKTLE